MTLIFYAVLLARKLPKHSAKWTSPRPDPRPLCPPVKCCHLRAEPRRRRPDPPAPGPPSRRPRRRVCEGGQSLVRGEDAASGGGTLGSVLAVRRAPVVRGSRHGEERGTQQRSPGISNSEVWPWPLFPSSEPPPHWFPSSSFHRQEGRTCFGPLRSWRGRTCHIRSFSGNHPWIHPCGF